MKRGPAVSAIPAEPSLQHTHQLNVVQEWAQAKQQNNTDNRIMKNNKPVSYQATKLWGGLLHSNG